MVVWGLVAALGMGAATRAADDQADPKYPHTVYVKGRKEPFEGKILSQSKDKIVLLYRTSKGGGTQAAPMTIARADVRIVTIVDRYIDKGETELDLGNTDAALEYFRKAQNNLSPEVVLDLADRKAKAHALKGKSAACHFAKGMKILKDPQADPADALDELRKVYDFNKKWPDLESTIASIFLKWADEAMPKERSEAQPADFAAALDPLNRFLSEWYPKSPRGLDAKRDIEQQVESIRQRGRSLQAEARTLYGKGKYKEAIKKVDDALAVDPDLAGARHLRHLARNRYQVLPYGDFGFPDTYEPISMAKDVEKRLAQLVFEGMFDVKPKETPLGAGAAKAEYFNMLASSHRKSADGLTHTVELKKHLRWSDGQALTANDVKFTIDVMTNPKSEGNNPGWASCIDSVRVDDTHRVSIRFSTQPVKATTLLSFKIIPSHRFRDACLKRTDAFYLDPIGCGPFRRLEEHRQEGEVRLVRNPEFWIADRPRLGRSGLSAADISDWHALCMRINRDRAQAGPNPSRRIWELLSGPARKAVEDGARTDRLPARQQDELVRALNDCLKCPEFYRQQDFSHVVFPSEAKPLLAGDWSKLSDLEVQTLNRIVLDESYPQDIAKHHGLREIVLLVYSNSISARNDFDNGRINVITELGPEHVNYFDSLGEKRARLCSYQTRAVYFLALNHRRKPFQNRELRLAILSAFDRHEVVRYTFKGGKEGGQAHRVITGPYPSMTWPYDDSIKEHPYNPTEAKNTVQRLSQEGPLSEITLKCPGRDHDTLRACRYIADKLRSAGFSVRLESRPEAALERELRRTHDFDIVYTRFSLDERLDVSPLFDPQCMGPGGSNYLGYVNDELSERFGDLRRRVGALHRETTGHEIHRIVHEDLPILPLWQFDGYAVYSPKLRGVTIHPYNFFAFPEEWHIVEQEEE